MEFTDIMSAISTVGFPIVACIGVFWQMSNLQKQLMDAVANNTKALTELTAMLKGETTHAE